MRAQASGRKQLRTCNLQVQGSSHAYHHCVPSLTGALEALEGDNGGVIITDELDTRPSRLPDYAAESRALNALAEAMSIDPDTVLQHLVELAMELTHSESAGISLLEPSDDGSIFRWVATTGAWSSYQDGTIPANASPCGEVIARNTVLLMKSPERAFPALQEADARISEALLAPFYIGGVAVGTLWAVKHHPDGQFEAEDARILKCLARFASAAQQTLKALRVAQAASQQAEARVQQLVALAEISSEFFGTCDLEFRLIYSNAAAMRMVGIADLKQLKQTRIQELFFPEDQAFITQEFFPRVLREGHGNIETRFRHFVTGEPVWVTYSLVALKDAMGQPTGFGTVTHNITERKSIEESLRTSEIRYRRLFEAAHDGVLILDPVTQKIIDTNPFMTKLLGYSRDEIIGKELFEIGFLADVQASQNMFRTLKETRQVRYDDLPLQTDEETTREVEVVANLYDEDGRTVVQCNVRDITERKRAELVLSESAQRQAFLLKLSDALREERSADAIANRALKLLFDQMRLDRCYVGIYRLEEDKGEFPHQVHNDALPPMPAHVRLSDFPEGVRIASDRTVIVDNVMEMEGLCDSERAGFTGLGIGALITATLRKGVNIPLWSICAASVAPRVWKPGEVSLVEEVAERTWAAVERARAKERLQSAHDTFRQLVDGSPFGIYVINADFTLVQMSVGGKKAFASVQPLIGRDFGEVLHAVWPDFFANEILAHFRHTLATGEPFKTETNERRTDIDATETYDWQIERVILPDGRFGVVCHFYDLSERKQHEEHGQLLMAEVNHRAKNLLSVVQSVAQQTAKSGDPLTFVARLSDRIGGLAANQDLLVKNYWQGVGVRELVTSQLRHFKDLIGQRIHVYGPELMVTAAASQAIGMAVHELATNASKYGALSNSTGQITVEWQLSADPQPIFSMSWVETKGPIVKAPSRTGFGQTVIKRLIEIAVSGTVVIDYAAKGFSWHLQAPAANVIAPFNGVKTDVA